MGRLDLRGTLRICLLCIMVAVLSLPAHALEGELIVDEGRTAIVKDSTLILTGNVTVKDESHLLVSNSRIQLSIRGEKPYNVSALDLGEITMKNSTLETLSEQSVITLSGRSNLTLKDSNITGFKTLRSSSNSSISVQGGRLDVDYVESAGNGFSIIDSYMPTGRLNITAAHAALKNFKGDQIFLNVTKTSLNKVECNLLRAESTDPLYLNNSRVEEGFLQSSGEVVVADSTFDSLTFNSSGVAVNVVISGGKEPRAGGAISARDNSTVRRYWYLRVKVTDLAGSSIPARIIITDYFGNITFAGDADVEGVFRKPILAEIVNGSKTVFVGNYKVKAEYLNYTTTATPLVLDRNRELTLRFMGYVPLETTTILQVSPTLVRVGDPVKIRGWITSRDPGEYVEVLATGPGGAKFQSAYKTDEKGFYQGEFVPYREGKWVIYADWIGGGRQGASTKSRAFTILAEPRPSITTLFIRALPMAIIVLGILTAITFLALSRLKRVRM